MVFPMQLFYDILMVAYYLNHCSSSFLQTSSFMFHLSWLPYSRLREADSFFCFSSPRRSPATLGCKLSVQIATRILCPDSDLYSQGPQVLQRRSTLLLTHLLIECKSQEFRPNIKKSLLSTHRNSTRKYLILHLFFSRRFDLLLKILLCRLLIHIFCVANRAMFDVLQRRFAPQEPEDGIEYSTTWQFTLSSSYVMYRANLFYAWSLSLSLTEISLKLSRESRQIHKSTNLLANPWANRRIRLENCQSDS